MAEVCYCIDLCGKGSGKRLVGCVSGKFAEIEGSG